MGKGLTAEQKTEIVKPALKTRTLITIELDSGPFRILANDTVGSSVIDSNTYYTRMIQTSGIETSLDGTTDNMVVSVSDINQEFASLVANNGDVLTNRECKVEEVIYTHSDTSNNIVPHMTSATTPLGTGIVTTSCEISPLDAWHTYYVNPNSQPWATYTNNWNAYEFLEGPKVVTGYALQPRGDSHVPAQNPKAWKIEAWDGSDWVVLDTQSNQSWTFQEVKYFEINNSTAYSKYRIYVTEAESLGTICIGNLQYFTEAIVGDPVLLFDGKINKVQLSVRSFTFTVERILNNYSSLSPNMVYDVNCQWKFKSGKCGYSGTETKCDKSLARCKALSNVTNFGGYPSVILPAPTK